MTPTAKRRLGTTLALLSRLAWARLLGPRLMPRHVRTVISELLRHGFEARAVGGAVRDLLLGRRPEDWDVTTSATPLYVMSIFARTIPIGVRHGTVRVLDPSEKAVDVTTYRLEGPYTDRRRPDHVEFTGSLVDDLSRRDFTVNAMAMTLAGRLIDPMGGLSDLACGAVRCVGEPDERFSEDALRMMRAVRLACELGFVLDGSTSRAIKRQAPLLAGISVERVRDEFDRCLLSPRPDVALNDLKSLNLLRHIIPELLEGVGFEQSEHDAYTVWEHAIAAVTGTPAVLHLRLSALLHDVAKPRTLSIENGRRRFVGHEKAGAQLASEIMGRLRYDKAMIARVTHLVRHHMSFWPPDMTDAAVRRLINRVGRENISDLIELKRAGCRASGLGEGATGRGTSALLVRITRLARTNQVFAVSDLAVDGDDVARVARIAPGPQVGVILKRLLEEVLEDPTLNDKKRLAERIQEMVRPGLPQSPGSTSDSS